MAYPAAAAPSVAESQGHTKRDIIVDVLALGASRYVAFAVSFVASIVQRRLLGPYVIGIWQLLSVCRIYLSYWDGGIARGAEQRLPALVATDPAEAARCRDTAYTWIVLTMVIGNAVVLAGSFAWAWPVDSLLLWGIRAMTIIAMVEGFSNIMEASALRARARFRLMSVQVLLSEGVFALLSVPAAMIAGLGGLLFALFVSMAIKPIFMRLWTGESFTLRFDRPRAAALLRIGFPLTLFAIVYKTFDSVDRFWVLGGAGGVEALGYYSIASMAVVFLAQVPQVIATVFFPRTIARFAAGSDESRARYFQQAQLCMVVGVGVATGACFFLLPPVMTVLLPNFAPGVPALKAGVFSAVFVGAAQVPIQYLTAGGRQWHLAIAITIAAAAYYAAGLLLASWFGETAQWLAVVAWGRVGAFLLLEIAMTVWAMTEQAAVSWGWFAETTAISAYLVALPVAIDSFLGWAPATFGAQLVQSLLHLLFYSVAVAPVAWLVERRTAAVSHVIALCRSARP